MTRKLYPEYHKALLEQTLYPSATRRIKFEETRSSYVYKTGDHVYKIAKPSAYFSSLAVKERYIAEALAHGQLWAGDCYEAMVPILSANGTFTVGGEGTAVDYALRMKQLTGHHFGDELLAAGKLNAPALGRVARFLSDMHKAHPLGTGAAEAGRPEHFRDLFDEIGYQVKKYIGQNLSEAMFEMIARPVERFIDEGRKIFLRRTKRGRIVDGHGEFVPDRVFLKGKDVLALTPISVPNKYRHLDAANDVATFRNALHLTGAAEAEDVFLKRYMSSARDRDLPRILPAYEVFQALRAGLDYCEWRVEAGPGAPEFAGLGHKAQEQFNLALHRAREVPKEA